MSGNLGRIQFNTDAEMNPINYSAWPYNKIIADTKASWIYADPNSYSIVPIPIVDVVRGDNLFIGNREDDDIFNIVYRHWNYILKNIFYIHFNEILEWYCNMSGINIRSILSNEEKEFIGWNILYPYMQVNKIELIEDTSQYDEVGSLMIVTSFEHQAFNNTGCNLLQYTRLDIYHPFNGFRKSEEDEAFGFTYIGSQQIKRNSPEQYESYAKSYEW